MLYFRLKNAAFSCVQIPPKNIVIKPISEKVTVSDFSLSDVPRPSDWRSPAPLCVRRWSVWNKRWSRRRRSNACWRSNYETLSERGRTRRTATGFWRRRWRISFPRWEIWLWVRGLVTFDTAKTVRVLSFRGSLNTSSLVYQGVERTGHICVHSGRTEIWRSERGDSEACLKWTVELRCEYTPWWVQGLSCEGSM